MRTYLINYFFFSIHGRRRRQGFEGAKLLAQSFRPSTYSYTTSNYALYHSNVWTKAT